MLVGRVSLLTFSLWLESAVCVRQGGECFFVRIEQDVAFFFCLNTPDPRYDAFFFFGPKKTLTRCGGQEDYGR